jgi:hypothetical protein
LTTKTQCKTLNNTAQQLVIYAIFFGTHWLNFCASLWICENAELCRFGT